MQLTVTLPDEIARRVRRLPDRDRNRFVAEALSRALDDRPTEPESSEPTPMFGSAKGLIEMADDFDRPLESESPRMRFLSKEEHRRWATEMRATFKLEGEPLPIEEIQKMSRESSLEENELSRAIIEAREE